jgi:hypothetical protein
MPLLCQNINVVKSKYGRIWLKNGCFANDDNERSSITHGLEWRVCGRISMNTVEKKPLGTCLCLIPVFAADQIL